jgi:hypothetical protein
VHDAQDSIAGGLGLFGGYGYFFTQQTIEQGGFSGVGSSYDGDVAGLKVFVCVASAGHFNSSWRDGKLARWRNGFDKTIETRHFVFIFQLKN